MSNETPQVNGPFSDSHPQRRASLDTDYRPLNNEEGAMGLFKSLRDEFYDNSTAEKWEITEERIRKIFEEFTRGELQNGAPDSVFLIHPRDPVRPPEQLPSGYEQFYDIRRHFPALDQGNGIPPLLIEQLFLQLPPFEIGRIKGSTDNGEAVDCMIAAASITPTSLYMRAGSDRIRFAGPRIVEAAAMAERWGAKIIGLGETLAALTLHGKKLQEAFPNLKVTTGHGITILGILQANEYLLKRVGATPADIKMLVSGADGAIGSSVTHLMAEDGVRSFILHEVQDRGERLGKKLEVLQAQYPGLTGEIVLGQGEELREAYKCANIAVSGAGVLEPFVTRDLLAGNNLIGYIDDSQPPSLLRSIADEADVPLIWPLIHPPEGITRSFDYGLQNGAEFGCASEVLLLTMLQDNGYPIETIETTGPVTPGRVKQLQSLAAQYGFYLPDPQSFGELVNQELINRAGLKYSQKRLAA